MKRSRSVGVFIVVALAALLAGCPKKPEKDPNADAGATSPSATNAAVTPKEHAGDAAKGKELVGSFQCNRCHDGTGPERIALLVRGDE